MQERKVMIGSGSRERLIKELRRMADEMEKDGETSFYCDANALDGPGLALSFTHEPMEPDWDDPLVDYG